MTRRRLRPLALAAALPALLGTSCIHTRSVQVRPVPEPAPALTPVVLFDSVHAVMSRFVVGRGYALPDSARHRDDGIAEWCVFDPRHGPGICWSAFEGAVAVQVSERGGSGMSAHADSVQRRIAAMLAERFGADAVRPCQWHVEVDRGRSRWWSTKTRSECIVRDTATHRRP